MHPLISKKFLALFSLLALLGLALLGHYTRKRRPLAQDWTVDAAVAASSPEQKEDTAWFIEPLEMRGALDGDRGILPIAHKVAFAKIGNGAGRSHAFVNDTEVCSSTLSCNTADSETQTPGKRRTFSTVSRSAAPASGCLSGLRRTH